MKTARSWKLGVRSEMSDNRKTGNKLQTQKLVDGQAGLLDDGSQRSFGKVSARMIRYNGSTASGWVVPDFMTAFRVTVKDKTHLSKSSDDFNGSEWRKSRHDSTGTGTVNETLAPRFFPKDIRDNAMGRGSLCSRQDSMSFRATSSAISNVSATVRPCATSPCRTGLVAKNSPSRNHSTVIGIKYSDMAPSSIAELDTRAQDQRARK
jgi:hypothetical protein